MRSKARLMRALAVHDTHRLQERSLSDCLADMPVAPVRQGLVVDFVALHQIACEGMRGCVTIRAMVLLSFSTAQYVVEVIGLAAFALSAVIEAARRRLDIVGVAAVALLSAFGGGTLRDVLLDRRPLFWVENSEQLWLVLLLAIAAVSFMRARHFAPTERAMQLPDAIGMGLFCASGAQIALNMDMPALVAVMMGVITAVFGGVLRDIVCNEIPRVFRDHRPYAICAFAGAWVAVAVDALDLPEWLCLFSAAATATLLRVLAIKLNWKVAPWRVD